MASEKYERVALQDPAEMAEFLKLVQREKVTSYLEIGGKHGGSLWKVAGVLPIGSKIVSVDLPHGDQSFKETLPNLQACVKRLRELGYDAHLIIGDSTHTDVVEQVRFMAPFDLCLIDANHTEPYVRRDWANYGPMAKIIAFHDIGWRANGRVESKNFMIQVPKVWADLKRDFRHQEIKLCHTGQDNGFGILWRC